MKISTRQVKAARALLGWSQDDLARHSAISKPTIARLEAAEGELGGYPATAENIQRALESAGVIFAQSNGDGPGVRLRRRKKSPEKRALVRRVQAIFEETLQSKSLTGEHSAELKRARSPKGGRWPLELSEGLEHAWNAACDIDVLASELRGDLDRNERVSHLRKIGEADHKLSEFLRILDRYLLQTESWPKVGVADKPGVR